MKTKDVIKRLQELDPTGEMPVKLEDQLMDENTMFIGETIFHEGKLQTAIIISIE